MYTRNHAILSALVGIPVATGGSDIHSQVLVWIYVIIVGSIIDIDHFLIARLNSGSWMHLSQSVRNPHKLFLDQAAIFNPGDLFRDQRLFSHFLIFGFATGAMWFVSPFLSFATAVAIYTHILADLYSDMRTRDEYIMQLSRIIE